MNQSVSSFGFFHAAIFCAAAMLSATARAEDNCGLMLVTTLRFDGIVQSINQLAQWSGPLTSIGDADPRYVVSMSVNKMAPNDVIAQGSTLNLAVHSPVHLFAKTPRVGAQVHLQLEAMKCDGTFRRFSNAELQPSSTPEQFSGQLELGKTYRASTRWDKTYGLELTTRLQVPMHHDGGVEWSNPEDFAKLGLTSRTQTVIFEVLSRETRQVAEWEWITIYTCVVRSLKSGA